MKWESYQFVYLEQNQWKRSRAYERDQCGGTGLKLVSEFRSTWVFVFIFTFPPHSQSHSRVKFLFVIPFPPITHCCSIAKLCPTLCNTTDCSTPDFPVLRYLPKFAQTRVHWVGDAIQPSHPLSPPSPPALNLSQHQSLFQWVSSSHQVAEVLEFQLQHQSFQWIFRVDFL